MAVLNSTLRLTLLDQVSSRAKHIGGALDTLQRRQTSFMAPLQSGMGALLAAGGAYLGVSAGLSATAGAAIKFESAFADVKKVVDATDEQFENMSRTIRQMSTELPLTAVDIAALFAAAGESGVATNDLKTFAEMAARVGIAFDMTAGEAGESLAKLKTQLGLTVAETGDMADAINHLSNNMASKAKDVTDFMLRVGALAEMGGFTKEQIAGIGSAMIAAGAQAETAGTAMQNVVKAMTRGNLAKAGQREAARALGLDLPAIAKEMQRDAPKAMKKVLTAISKQSKDKHLSLLSDFFGDEAKAFAPLIGNIGLLDQALDSVADKTNYAGSAFREYVARANTVENVLQLLRNKFSYVFEDMGQEWLPAIKEGIAGIGDVLDTLDERATPLSKLSATIEGFANGMGYNGDIREFANDVGDLLLGSADASKAADDIGRAFMKGKEWGASLRELNAAIKESPINSFMAELAGSVGLLAISKWSRLFVIGWGISAIVNAVKDADSLGEFLENLRGLSALEFAGIGAGLLMVATRAAKVVKWFKELKGITPKPTVPSAPAAPSPTKIGPPPKPPASWTNIFKKPGQVGLPMFLQWAGETGIRTGFQTAYGENYREPPSLGESLSGTYDAWKNVLGATPNAYAGSEAQLAAQRGLGYTPTMQAVDQSPIRIDAASLAEMVRPSGTQDVRVTNQQPVIVNQTVNQVIHGVSDPVAAADASAARLGEASKAAYEASFSD